MAMLVEGYTGKRLRPDDAVGQPVSTALYTGYGQVRWTVPLARTPQVLIMYPAGAGHVSCKYRIRISQVPDTYPTDTGHVCTSQLASTGHVPSRWYRLVSGAVTCTVWRCEVIFLPRAVTYLAVTFELLIYLQLVTWYFFSNPVWETSAPATDLEVRDIGP